MVENPAHVAASIYGNRFPLPSFGAGYGYNDDDYRDFDEELLKVDIVIDTSQLTEKEEHRFIVELEDALYISDEELEDYVEENYGRNSWATVDPQETDDGKPLIVLKGLASDSMYDKIYEVLYEYKSKIAYVDNS